MTFIPFILLLRSLTTVRPWSEINISNHLGEGKNHTTQYSDFTNGWQLKPNDYNGKESEI